jgi:hypothetical protein
LARSKSKIMASLSSTFSFCSARSLTFVANNFSSFSVLIYTYEKGICAKLRWISIILERLRGGFVWHLRVQGLGVHY